MSYVSYHKCKSQRTWQINNKYSDDQTEYEFVVNLISSRLMCTLITPTRG